MAPIFHGKKHLNVPCDICVYGDLDIEKKFYAHRILLVCISPYFEKLFHYKFISPKCTHCSLSSNNYVTTPLNQDSTGQSAGDRRKRNSSIIEKQMIEKHNENFTNDQLSLSNKTENKENLRKNLDSLLLNICACKETFNQAFSSYTEIKDLQLNKNDLPINLLEHLCLIGLDSEQVCALLQFAYDGQVQLNHSNVQRLTIAADMYSVCAMFNQCIRFLAQSIHVQNCVGIYLFALQLQCNALIEHAERFLLRNFECVSNQSSEFISLLSGEQLAQLLRQHRLYVQDEIIVFETTVRWLQHDLNTRATYAPTLIQYVRLALISEPMLKQRVLTHSLVQSHEQLIKLINRVISTKIKLAKLGRPDEQLLLDEQIRFHITPRYPLDFIFVFGGRALDVEFVPSEPVVEVYDYRAERWKQVSHLQDSVGARDHHAAIFFGGNIFILGGHSGPFNIFNSCRKFNLKNKKWTEISPMNEKRAFLAAAVMGDCIYALGGYNGAWRVNTAEKYNMKTNQWQQIPSMLERRSGAGAAVLDNKLYVVGGFRDLIYLNSAEVYCEKSNSWTLINCMQQLRSSPSVVAFNEHIYAIGGLTSGGLLASAERYDPKSGTWKILEDEMMEKKCSTASVVLDGKIYVIGGWNGVAGLNTVEIWCPQSKKWYLGSRLFKRRTGCAACVVTNLSKVHLYAYEARDELLKERFLNSFIDETSETSSNNQMQAD